MNCHQIKIKMSVEMSANKLVDLFLAPGVQVLELVEITDYIQPERKFNIEKLLLSNNKAKSPLPFIRAFSTVHWSQKSTLLL